MAPQFFLRETQKSIKWLFISLAGNFLLNGLIVYAFMPAMIGPLGGYQFLWFPLLVNFGAGICLSALGNNSEKSDIHAAAAWGSGITLTLLIAYILVVAIASTWGNQNTKARANFIPMEYLVAPEGSGTDAPEAFPDNDEAHIVMVEEETARFLGSQAMGSTGENLGSIFKPGKYTKQMVAGHLYWIAPIVYQHPLANVANQTSPGIIVVDAENPNVPAVLKRDHPLHYLPDAIFNQDLSRHAYLNGYSHWRLVDATLEVNDDWEPYFTLDVSTFQRGFYGIAVKGIITINSVTGEITPYNLAECPSWIDRALPLDGINENIDDYGRFYKAPWITFVGTNIEIRADDSTPVTYSKDGSIVYQYVMTSKNSTDFSSLGIILVDANKYSARRFPVYGIVVGSKVKEAFLNTESNKIGTDEYRYNISDPTLYNIYGRLTWVTTYVTEAEGEEGEEMSQYYAIGFLDAHNVNPSHVQMAETKEQALRKYQHWLANPPSDTLDPNQKAPELSLRGDVVMIIPEVEGGNTTYYFMVRDEQGKVVNLTFSVNPTEDVREIRFTKVGDPVTFSYMDLGNGTGSVTDFDNLVIPPK